MYKCKRCKADNLTEAVCGNSFRIGSVCINCYNEDPDPMFRNHASSKLCLFIGCLNYESIRRVFPRGLCDAHLEEQTEHRQCIRCKCRYHSTQNQLCETCFQSLATKEFRDYRKEGTIKEIQAAMKELQDYRTLGTYEDLADAVSRRDVYEHCDELDLS